MHFKLSEKNKIKLNKFMKYVKELAVFVGGALVLDLTTRSLGQQTPAAFTVASFCMNYVGGSMALYLYEKVKEQKEIPTLTDSVQIQVKTKKFGA